MMDFQALKQMERAEELTPLRFREMDDELFKARLGRLTGSNFGKLVVKTKDRKGYTLSKGETATNLIFKVAWERLLMSGCISNGLGRLNVSSASMEHGLMFEQEAIQLYMQRTGNTVDYQQKFIEHDEFIGGTPDGYVGEDGLIEVKCPFNGGLHLRGIYFNEIYNPEYTYQIQGYLWITGRKWCDFITYDPEVIPQLQLNIIRVERDEEVIAGISEVMELAKQRVIEIMNHPKLNYHERENQA